jgi:16S rRNA processing protein RimM
VRRPHGLGGELSVGITTDFPERFVEGLSLLWKRGAEERPVIVVTARRHGKRMLLTFDAARDLESARSLVGGDLYVAEKDAFPAPEGFYYSHEVEGWSCVDRRGRQIGIVRQLGPSAAGPQLEIETAEGKEALIPFVQGIVVALDRPGRRIILDPPAGLLDL